MLLNHFEALKRDFHQWRKAAKSLAGGRPPCPDPVLRRIGSGRVSFADNEVIWPTTTDTLRRFGKWSLIGLGVGSLAVPPNLTPQPCARRLEITKPTAHQSVIQLCQYNFY